MLMLKRHLQVAMECMADALDGVAREVMLSVASLMNVQIDASCSSNGAHSKHKPLTQHQGVAPSASGFQACGASRTLT
jgi:hypothetical protein